MSGTTWEPVYDNPGDRMERTPLPDGYLYRNWIAQGSDHTRVVWLIALVYVPNAAPAP